MNALSSRMTPSTPLQAGEHVVESFVPDRGTYIRDHAWMAVIAMAGGMVILWAIGNPHVWTGAIGGLAAIVVRGGYVASDGAVGSDRPSPAGAADKGGGFGPDHEGARSGQRGAGGDAGWGQAFAEVSGG